MHRSLCEMRLLKVGLTHVVAQPFNCSGVKNRKCQPVQATVLRLKGYRMWLNDRGGWAGFWAIWADAVPMDVIASWVLDGEHGW